MSSHDSHAPENDELDALRTQIDGVDQELLSILVRRMALIRDVAEFKRTHQRKVRDGARERSILDTRRAWAEQLGLPPELIESLFRLILWASRDQQAALRAEVPTDMQPQTVAIIGGKGGLGERLARMFDELGHETLIVDVDTDLTAEEAAARADVTVVSVPIAITAEVIRQVGPHVRPECLLMDVTSLKGAPMAAMLDATQASVVGTHPMFGPGVHSFQGQRVVVCDGRGEAWGAWVRDLFRSRGLVITDATPEEHDRAMAAVQVLTHFQTQVLGLTLARLGSPLSEGLRFTSPAYLMELYVAARHFGQDPALYGPIEMENPQRGTITATFTDAAREIGEILERRDQHAFVAMFEEVRAFFGEFSAEATEQSSFLIDRLVERS